GLCECDGAVRLTQARLRRRDAVRAMTGGNMRIARWCRRSIGLGVIAAAAGVLGGCGGGGGGATAELGPIPDTVRKASCGSNDKPETELQGQVSAAVRAAGFKGYSCNLELVGQTKNDGGSWQHAFFTDLHGHVCNYYDTASFTANRTQTGVVVV